MKKLYFIILLLLAFTPGSFALPRVHIIATGGTIVGTTEKGAYGYNAGQVEVSQLLSSVPQLGKLAEIDYEQLCQIGSQDMNETIWLQLAQRINFLQRQCQYDGIVVTHGTDTMEETAYFLNLTTYGACPVILVGAMRPSDAPHADGPNNLITAVKAAINRKNSHREVLCCLGGKIYEAGSVFKNNTREVEAFASNQTKRVVPPTASTSFDIEGVTELPKVGIVYGYAGCSTLPFQSFVEAGYDGVVIAGVGMGNLYAAVDTIAMTAVQQGMAVVRSSRVPYGGVYTALGETDDYQKGYIAAGDLNPQKARILLMLALLQTRDTKRLRSFFL